MYNKFILIVFIPVLVAIPPGKFPIFFAVPLDHDNNPNPRIPWRAEPQDYLPESTPMYQDSVLTSPIKPEPQATTPASNKFPSHKPQPPIYPTITPHVNPHNQPHDPHNPNNQPSVNPYNPNNQPYVNPYNPHNQPHLDPYKPHNQPAVNPYNPYNQPHENPYSPHNQPPVNPNPHNHVPSPISDKFQPIPMEHRPQYPKYPFLIPNKVPDICSEILHYCG